MAMTSRQVNEYGSMSFEELCDLIDQYKEDEEELNEKIEQLKEQIEQFKEQIEQMESAINSLQSM